MKASDRITTWVCLFALGLSRGKVVLVELTNPGLSWAGRTFVLVIIAG